MKQFLYFLISVLFFVQFSGCESSQKVLILLGGHAYDTLAFMDMFKSMNGFEFDTMSYFEAFEMLCSDGTEDIDLIVHYHYYPDLPPEDSVMYIQLSEKGTPMLFLHHSICSFQSWEGYRQMVGGRYVLAGYHTDTAYISDYEHDLKLSVEVLDQKHPVTRGISDFEILDEGYTRLQMEEGITPLLKTAHPDCTPVVGWTKDYKNSSSVYLLFGHDHHAFENPHVKKLIYQSLIWLLDKKDASESI